MVWKYPQKVLDITGDIGATLAAPERFHIRVEVVFLNLKSLVAFNPVIERSIMVLQAAAIGLSPYRTIDTG